MKQITSLDLSVSGLQLKVGVFSALQSARPSFELCDSRDLAKIKCPRINSVTNTEVPQQFVAKSFMRDDRRTLVPDDVLSSLKPSPQDQISFTRYCDDYAVPLAHCDNLFYLSPLKGWESNYSLVYHGLSQFNLFAVVKTVFMGCSAVLALGVFNNSLVIYKLRFPAQVLVLDAPVLEPLPKDSPVFNALCQAFTSSCFPYVVISDSFEDDFTLKFNNWTAALPSS